MQDVVQVPKIQLYVAYIGRPSGEFYRIFCYEIVVLYSVQRDKYWFNLVVSTLGGHIGDGSKETVMVGLYTVAPIRTNGPDYGNCWYWLLGCDYRVINQRQ